MASSKSDFQLVITLVQNNPKLTLLASVSMFSSVFQPMLTPTNSAEICQVKK